MKTLFGFCLLLLGCCLTSATPQEGMQQGEWLTITGDRGSTKYSSLDQIDATNVDQLNVAWRSPSPQNPLRFSVGA